MDSSNVTRIDFKNKRVFGGPGKIVVDDTTKIEQEDVITPINEETGVAQEKSQIDVLLLAIPEDVWKSISDDLTFYSGNKSINRQPGFDHGKRAEAIMFKIASCIYAKQTVNITQQE
jgi:hypothetical protein